MNTTVLKERGGEAFRQGQYQEAVAQWTRAIEDPACDRALLPSLLCNRSVAYMKLGRSHAAIDDAEECVRIKPSWAKGHGRKGQALVKVGLFAQAAEAFAAASRLEPANREYSSAASDARARAQGAGGGAGGGPYPPAGGRADGAGGGGFGLGHPAIADAVAWLQANQTIVLQGLAVFVALFFLYGGGGGVGDSQLGYVLLMAGAALLAYRSGMSPFQIMMLLNMLNRGGGGGRRGYRGGGYGGMGGFGRRRW